ncbi:MAG: SPOR domain-containing protein [Synergistaceae bacterium]|jgi:cell division septation protein DedD|nr:SPOR domain-containing protein [Synergistaceae bacterium]
MTATSRRSRNYKERNSMLAFGHFALPVAAMVALGLLFVGIKLFFLTPVTRHGGVELGGPIAQGQQESEYKFADEIPIEPAQGQFAVMNVQESDAARFEAGTRLAGPMTTNDSGGRVQAPKPAQASKPQASAKPSTKPSATTKKVQNTPTNGKWSVQIGAFSNAAGASTVVSEMKKQGYTASISQSSAASGSTFHRVRVAAGNSKEEAGRLAAELEKKGYPVLVVPTN